MPGHSGQKTKKKFGICGLLTLLVVVWLSALRKRNPVKQEIHESIPNRNLNQNAASILPGTKIINASSNDNVKIGNSKNTEESNSSGEINAETKTVDEYTEGDV